MNLFLLRHAKAEPRSEKGGADSKRTLSSKGEKTIRAAAKGMRRLDLNFDVIMTSPYVRAARTAEVTADILKIDKVWTSPNLGANGNPSKLIDEINANCHDLKDILLVGHEPYLSKLVSILLTGDCSLRMELKKAALCKLSVDTLRLGHCASLDWLLTPQQLQKIGKK